MTELIKMKRLALIMLTLAVIAAGCKKDPPEEQTTVTDIDGNVYNIIKIGNQEWMDRNLAVTHYRNGTAIHSGLSTANDEGAWSDYNNDPAIGAVYGKLYNSQAVHDPRGLAPEGWHVATRDDWTALIETAGGLSVAGGKLKETGTAHWDAPNEGASDEFGFKALPGGYGVVTFSYLGKYGGFWTSTKVENSPGQTYMFWLYAENTTVETDSSTPLGFSVRCVRD